MTLLLDLQRIIATPALNLQAIHEPMLLMVVFVSLKSLKQVATND